jgi:hypothetical protein
MSEGRTGQFGALPATNWSDRLVLDMVLRLVHLSGGGSEAWPSHGLPNLSWRASVHLHVREAGIGTPRPPAGQLDSNQGLLFSGLGLDREPRALTMERAEVQQNTSGGVPAPVPDRATRSVFAYKHVQESFRWRGCLNAIME